jgi:polyphosphate kinase
LKSCSLFNDVTRRSENILVMLIVGCFLSHTMYLVIISLFDGRSP